MPKKTVRKKIHRKGHSSRKKHLSFGVIAGAISVAIFILYLGYNNIKINSINSFDECAQAGNPVMESYPRQCRANGITYIEKIRDDSPLAILQIDKSENGRFIHIERGNYIINSEAEWDEIFGKMDVEPNVDFSSKTVIAVVMGQKPTGGYSVSLKQLEITENEIQFLVEEEVPGTNCVVTQMITNPYQLIAIDKTEKEIKFVGNTITNNCE